ncbi:MAG: methyltransferase [Chlorobi bacterium]|nr:methyltransferase [Chlorobiota bacterium]
MKTGSDAILLGIWARIDNVKTVLDVGSGSGIISLLIASRCNAAIDAVEIDLPSVEESSDNFSNSAFADSLNIINEDFNEYAKKARAATYDLIVSNPPFFTSDLHSPNLRKTNTRHTTRLKYSELCSGVNILLSEDGSFNLVVPYFMHERFIAIAKKDGLFLNRRLLIFPRRGFMPNRINMEFKKTAADSVETGYFIIREENNNFTAQYREWLEAYYLSIPEN